MRCVPWSLCVSSRSELLLEYLRCCRTGPGGLNLRCYLIVASLEPSMGRLTLRWLMRDVNRTRKDAARGGRSRTVGLLELEKCMWLAWWAYRLGQKWIEYMFMHVLHSAELEHLASHNCISARRHHDGCHLASQSEDAHATRLHASTGPQRQDSGGTRLRQKWPRNTDGRMKAETAMLALFTGTNGTILPTARACDYIHFDGWLCWIRRS